MFWPGMGDPTKRKKTLKFMAMLAAVGMVAAAVSSLVQGQISMDDPLKVCIDDRQTPYKVSAFLEMYIDDQRIVPSNVGTPGGVCKSGLSPIDQLFASFMGTPTSSPSCACQRSLYSLNDGTIYAEWEEPYPFEIGHFLWMWDFPVRDMDTSKSRILLDGVESPDFINTPLIDGASYRAEFTSRDFDEAADSDFLPPDV